MQNTNLEWKTLINSDPFISKSTKLTSVQDHPLKLTVVERIPRRILGSLPNTGRTTPVSTPAIMLDLNAALEGIDPLSKFVIEETDPLTQMATEMTGTHGNYKKSRDKTDFDFEPWNLRKQGILSKYTTSEKLSIITSFLSDGEKVVVKSQGSAVDKVQHRLEQLDCFEEGSQKKFDVSQAEYIRRIEQLNKELVLAWNTNQRVKALKIAIQCAKLLSDTEVMYFYPSKFVLVTDILDIFGHLVYERLRTKTDSVSPGSKGGTCLPEDFTSDLVSDITKETCRNWFYKIASIRELVPRIYVEMAILKSYNFVTTREYATALLRLAKMIRGIGNPLVAAYARCYLCRIGITLTASKPENASYLLQNFYDFLRCYNHISSKTMIENIRKQNLEFSVYSTLYTPALDFILQAVKSGASDNLFPELLEKCKRHGNSSLLLNTIISAFKPSDVSIRALEILEMIELGGEAEFPRHLLLRKLGSYVSACPPLAEHQKQVLQKVWRQISSMGNSEQYIMCAEAWIQFTVQYFGSWEVNKIIGDIIRHMTPGRTYEKHYNNLNSVVKTIINNTNDFEALLSMDNFLPLVDLFQEENTRMEVCKSILGCSNIEQQTCDPVIVNALMFLCGILHDSVNALTVEDERRQIGDLISGVIRRVHFEDFEQQLSFYVECRGAFSNIDAVSAHLVQSVNSLSIKARYVAKGLHTRKTGAFVRACTAYCFITVPSIESVHTRLELYLLSARVALFNNCLGQADASLKAALTVIPELHKTDEKNDETFILAYMRNFLSTLLVVPDSPNQGVLNMTRSFLNILQQQEWNTSITTALYLNVLDLLSTMAQEKYPYHVDKLESNDALYGMDSKFITEIDKICSIIVREILNNLKKLGSCPKQAHLALELMIRIATKSDVSSNSMSSLTMNLWQLCSKDKQIDSNYMNHIKSLLKQKRLAVKKNEPPQLETNLNVQL